MRSTQTIFSESRVNDKKIICFSDLNAKAESRTTPAIRIILSDFILKLKFPRSKLRGNFDSRGLKYYRIRSLTPEFMTPAL
jgi:hypothetical protein